jgi:hypothetical protein
VSITLEQVEQKLRDLELVYWLSREYTRTGVRWTVDGLQMTRFGGHKAVIVASMDRRRVLRWSQDRWKKSD